MTSPHRYASSLPREDSDSSSSASRNPSYRLHQYGQRYIPQPQHQHQHQQAAHSRALAAQQVAAGSHFYTHPSRLSLLDPFNSHHHQFYREWVSAEDDERAAMMSGYPPDHRATQRYASTFPEAPTYTPHKQQGPSRRFEALRSTREDQFFVPSYLQHSTYVAQLKECHDADVKKRKADSDFDSTRPEDLPAGSHHGMSHTVRERVRDEGSKPEYLPTRWNPEQSYGNIEVSADGLRLKHVGPKKVAEKDHEFSSIRANNPIPSEVGIYYFEVTILQSRPGDTNIAIGFSSSSSALSRPVGWEPESWGYHGDDGQFITAHSSGKQYSQPFGKDDVIGVVLNFRQDAVSFIKNGSRLTNGPAFKNLNLKRYRLFPHVSMKKQGEEVKVNFGQSPFVYDIDYVMQQERKTVMQKVNGADTAQLAPSESETAMIQTLVLQYLRHDGFVETAKAFADDLNQQQRALNTDGIDTSDGKDDEDAKNRQRIRRAVLEGDIDTALTWITTHYPYFFDSYEQIHFELKCRRFIEIVRKYAVYAMEHSEGDTDMEVDHESDHAATHTALETQALEYGRQLQSENSQSKPRRDQLAEIFALLAHQNPLKEPGISHLLSKRGRIALAEELNSAILQSLGKSSRAALEKVYAQTSVLLDMLGKDGDDPAFVSVKEVVDLVPSYDQ